MSNTTDQGGAGEQKCPIEAGAGTEKKATPACPIPPAHMRGPPMEPEEEKIVDKILSNDRSKSNIPSSSGDSWSFPSERQFYKAARAKGHEVLPVDMASVLAIHNAVNEQSWKEILKYEEFHREECAIPKLLFFHGRPTELSWKAWIMMKVDGRNAPFDRHEWLIDRCGTRVKYIVDFYDGKPSDHAPVSIHIDARPELNVSGFVDRLRMSMRGMLPFLS